MPLATYVAQQQDWFYVQSWVDHGLIAALMRLSAFLEKHLSGWMLLCNVLGAISIWVTKALVEAPTDFISNQVKRLCRLS